MTAMMAASAPSRAWPASQSAASCRTAHVPSMRREPTCNRGGQACCSSSTARCAAGAGAAGETATVAAGDHPNAANWQLLRDFTQKQFRGQAQQYIASEESRSRVKVALLAAYHHPYPPAGWSPPPAGMVLLGVMASEARLAVRALRDYCNALNLAYVQPECKVPDVPNLMGVRGGVYIKYNSVSKVCYLSRYQGQDRGVLVQLGDLQFGHFPLGMFDEAMEAPPPALDV